MKIKTILGVIACAGACASYSAFANDTTPWFEVDASTKTQTTGVTIKTNNTDVAIAALVGSGTTIPLDNDEDTPLVILPGTVAEPALSDKLVTITAKAVLTPSDTNDLETTDIDGAKAGFAVAYDNDGHTNYYGYASGEGKWVKLTGRTPVDLSTAVTEAASNTTFKIVLDYRFAKVSYSLVEGETETTLTNGLSISLGGATSLTSVDAWGFGSIASVKTDCEVAVAAVEGVKYGSVADAIAAGGDGTTIKEVSSSGTIINKVTADNGLPVAVCKALGLDTDDSTANITVAPAVGDTDNDEIILAVTNVAGAPEGAVIQYKVEGGSEPQYYDEPGAIKIPLNAGTYTITPVLK